ncbi:MAG: hypothetical protein JWO31_259 [Phycisphaerales bacterium]|nr:hypothetical protein [Phycisphaerales bacterium]
MEAIRKFFKTPAGRVVGAILLLAGAVALYHSLRNVFGDSDAVVASKTRWFVCAQTGKPFRHELTLGESPPVDSPHSGAKTGYPAELCFWTADGKSKPEPTPVLLNSTIGKPGPTFCPDCKRLVVGHNPPPETGRSAPPTQSEYKPARKDPQNDR